MKKNPDGFLQLFRNPPKEELWKRPAWIRYSEVWLRENVGGPCSDFSPSCFVCQMWVAWAILHDHLSEPYKEAFEKGMKHPKKKLL